MLLMMVYAVGSSPHTRGARGRVHRHRRPVWIIPAYAGSTMSMSTFEMTSPDHPRIRGEHHSETASPTSKNGSSPHTRGAPSAYAGRTECSRIIPAYAGSTPGTTSASSNPGDHPRIRGEHDYDVTQRGRRDGSSPHTRGALTSSGSSSLRAADHPRIRGEHNLPTAGDDKAAGSSPHTRGAREGFREGRERLADHPRIRGEHTWNPPE